VSHSKDCSNPLPNALECGLNLGRELWSSRSKSWSVF
jgi:hypothetical protein